MLSASGTCIPSAVDSPKLNNLQPYCSRLLSAKRVHTISDVINKLMPRIALTNTTVVSFTWQISMPCCVNIKRHRKGYMCRMRHKTQLTVIFRNFYISPDFSNQV